MSEDMSKSTRRRLQAAWEAAEEECKENHDTSICSINENGFSASGRQAASSLPDDHDESATLTLNNGCSRDMQPADSLEPTHYEDPFLLNLSNETSPTSQTTSSSSALSSTKQRQQPQQLPTAMMSSSPSSSPSVLQRYRTFLQKHEPLLSLFEMIMERFVFYGHLFKVQHHENDDFVDYGEDGMIRTEMYYATWNVIRWINDVILVGVGDGMGFTVGTREEWLPSSSEESTVNNDDYSSLLSLQAWISSRMYRLVPIIRATLTASTCMIQQLNPTHVNPYYDNGQVGQP